VTINTQAIVWVFGLCTIFLVRRETTKHQSARGTTDNPGPPVSRTTTKEDAKTAWLSFAAGVIALAVAFLFSLRGHV
jgi:hypothetical protein